MIITLMAIIVFWCRFSAPMATSSAEFLSNADSIGALLAAQANQYSLLQIHLMLLTIILAIAAVWGYSGIKSHIEENVLRKIDHIVPKLSQEAIEKLGTEELSHRLFEKLQKASRKENTKEIFNKGIETITRGSDDE